MVQVLHDVCELIENEEMKKLIIKYSGDVNIKNKEGNSPITPIIPQSVY